MIFRPELVEKILANEKTETRRRVKNGEPCRYIEGNSYAVQPGRGKKGVARIKVTQVFRQRLGFIDEEGARAEGFLSRSMFMRYWGMLYGHVDMDQMVWVIRFRLESELEESEEGTR